MTPGLGTLFRVFGRIGLLSFGGPAAQIALMHRVLVDERRWLEERQFLGALSFCMLLPGPEAMQLATYAGWRLRGWPGGLLAGLLFVVPGALVVLALAAAYHAFGAVPLVAALFGGIKAAVVVIVVEALLRVARRALGRPALWAVAGLAFAAIYAFGVPFPLIVLAAGIWGALAPGAPETGPPPPLPRLRPLVTLGTVALWLALWAAPLLALHAAGAALLLELGLFFSKLAVVTFGGAYAVLAYMTQEVVAGRGWLTTPEMMDALGLAETTPGPLILVTEFVGFLVGAKAGGPLLGALAAAVTLWTTFVPCFLWIFAAAPYLDWIVSRPRLRGALAGITAAVVGVIGNLSIWFALHVLFAEVVTLRAGPLRLLVPEPGTLDLRALLLALMAAFLLFRRHWSLPAVLAASALGGLVLGGLGGS